MGIGQMLRKLKNTNCIQVLIIVLSWAFFLGGISLAKSPVGGVGMVLEKNPKDPGSVVVRSLTPGAPAQQSGIRQGDLLIKVDGIAVEGKTLEQIAAKIVGPVGSQVKLSIRSSNQEEREIVLKRVRLSETPAQEALIQSLTAQEKDWVKSKIANLNTQEQRLKMKELLQSYQDQKISKAQFLNILQKEF
jgi:C-terminal processing protease CtpA/Prc